MREFDFLARHFDIAVESPDGIKKLRGLILSLAMKGKLVPQNPNDQPASELLKEIEAEKVRLVKEGKIKKQETLPPIRPEEIPYDLPQGWEWCRLGTFTSIIRGITFPSREKTKEESTGRIACLRTANIQERIEWDDLLFIDRKFMTNELKLLRREDIVISMANSRELVGKVAIVDKLPHKEATFGGFLSIIRTNRIKSLYLLQILKSNHVRNKLVESASQTTNIANISLEKLNSLMIPLPPLAEQKRIVEKIDQLMALCDRLEAEKASRDHKRAALHAAAMNRLLGAPDAQAFAASWNFIAQNFGALYSTAENVADLKKAVLQLAVMGKLVPQNPNDQPASELLKEIEAEKARLVKEGKIKKQEPLPPVRTEEIPYDLPRGWEWVRFFDLNIVRSDLVEPREHLEENQIAPDSIEKGSGILLFDRTVKESGVTGPNHRFYKGQILYSKIRPSLSKAVIAPYDGLCSADMYPIETFIHSSFMLKVILSEMFLDQVRIAENRVKMPKLNLDSLGKFIIPLPPLAEQKRIVEKIDHLMALCDSLEQQIAGSTEKRSAILDAVLAKM